ncbi:TolC family protein [Pseudoalteromonas sp. B62]
MQSLQWWQSFEDEQLSELLIKGSTGNLDVREAFLRTQEAKALYRVEESRGQAEFSLDALGNRSLTSENGQIPLGQIPGAQTEGYFFNMGMAATWELDVFGRVKRAIEAADAKVEIAQSSYEGLLLTIQADIASTYFEIQQQNLQVEYLQQRIELRQKSLQMTAKRALAGAESFFQVALERSAFEELKSGVQ